MKVQVRKAKASAPDKAPQWKLGYFDAVEREARGFLTDDQYAHVVRLFNDLACESDPTKSEILKVEKIEDFYELKDRCGLLRDINLRIYFAVMKEKRVIVALAAYDKNKQGQTPKYMKLRVRNRLRVAKAQLK